MCLNFFLSGINFKYLKCFLLSMFQAECTFLQSEDNFCDGMNRSNSIWTVMNGSESEFTLCIRNVIVFCIDLQNCSLQPAKDIDAYTVHWHCTLYFCLSDEEPKKIIPRSCRYEQQQPQSMRDECKGTCRIASQFGQKLRYVWKNCHSFFFFFPSLVKTRCGTNSRVFERLY